MSTAQGEIQTTAVTEENEVSVPQREPIGPTESESHIIEPTKPVGEEGNINTVSDTSHVEAVDEQSPERRKSERQTKLTEKGRRYKEEEASKAFWKTYNECKSHIARVDQEVNAGPPAETLHDLVVSLEAKFGVLTASYEEVRNIFKSPPSEIRQTVDRVKGDTDYVIGKAQSQMARGWPAQRGTKTIDDISLHSRATRKSGRSRHTGISNTSSKRRETAARAAALQAELEAQEEEAAQKEELERLEMEEMSRRAEAEVKLEKHRRMLERHKIERQLRVEQAKLEVYDEDERDGVSLRSSRPNRGPSAQANGNHTSDHESKSPSDSNQNASQKTYTLNANAPTWVQPPPKYDTSDLAQALSAAVNLNRLPPPEPPVFSGDPLLYPDWEASFSTLIESRGISPLEKIHYLKRYLGGPAKEAVSGFFLLRSDNAFERAKELLQERYGSPHAVSEAFRDKIDTWPKIDRRNGKDLRRFTDFLQQCKVAMLEIKELEILNDTRESKKILQKLPDWVVTRWSRVAADAKKRKGAYPSFADFVEFLMEEAKIACDPITSLGALRDTPEKDKDKKPERKRRAGANTHTTAADEEEKPRPAAKENVPQRKRQACTLCNKDNHTLHNCRTFSAKPTTEKQEYVKKNGLCFGCLGTNHLSKNCKNKSTCKKCNKRHPTCLHEDKEREAPNNKEAQSKEKRPRTPDSKDTSITQNASSGRVSSSDSYCQPISSMIVPVWLSHKAKPHHEHLVYALLDTQSDTTFISEEIGDKLQVASEPTRLKISTMTSTSTVASKRFSNLQIRGINSSTNISLPIAYSRKYIPAHRSHIPTPDTARRWPHLHRIESEISPVQDCQVGLLIGYNCPQALAPRDFVTGEGSEPFAVKTDLGWSIVGNIDTPEDCGDSIGLTHRTITREVPENLQLKADHTKITYVCKASVKEEMVSLFHIGKLLESDFAEPNCQDAKMSQEDMRFLDIMRTNICQNENGHYVMPLPFKKDNPKLPNNRVVAERRLGQLKRRLKGDPKYFEDYKLFMQEMIDLNHAEKAPEVNPNESTWYIPHHGVYHAKKPDKLRVVFDCSSKFRGTCLNDHLLQGPDMINALIGVLCRFRLEAVAFMCDVEKMFHQFQIREEDKDYLRFLWWEGGNLNSEPTEYRMNVHLFGAVSSPGCANFGLKQVAMDYEKDFGAEAANFVDNDFYVDDGLKSVSTVPEAISLIRDVRNMCARGKLRLHKFISNSREVLESIPPSERAKEVKDLDLSFNELPIERALGVQWCVESDCFQFRLCIHDQPLTRRGILSTVASIYDPLGFLAPFVLIGKIILQDMCRAGMDWDDPLPDDLHQRWEQWIRELPLLSNLKIDRCFKPKEFGNVREAELHHFSDASTTGYGQCSFLRVVDDRDRVHCSLIMGKARVAPKKVVTIPRLELQAAVVSVKVSSLIKRELKCTIAAEYFWTDSKVVLGYINNDARRFHVYVANRVQTIKNSTDASQWRYVSTNENPADHASRSLNVADLLSSNWLTGPEFLWQRKVTSPNQVETTLSASDPEVKRTHTLTTNCKEATSLLDRFERFSDWSRLIKAVSVLQSYLSRKKGGIAEESIIIAHVKRRAEITVIKAVQREAFSEEMQSLQSSPTNDTPAVKRGTQLYKLDPFVDDQGILRVGGRLSQSSLPYDVKYPIILPKVGHIVNLLIKHHHEKIAHQGRGMTTNELRANGYWVLGCSKTVSSFIYKCVTCRKQRGTLQTPKMADLPKDRTEPSPPFTHCGIDCFGHFLVRDGRKEVKRYGLLISCMASRAIHIETLEDMSTDSFINGMRRFVALRGPISSIRCDQGSNFIGAMNALTKASNEIVDPKVKSFLDANKCHFVLNPPNASHMGGTWERHIRTIRSVLAALLKGNSSRLDSFTLRTLLYEVMAIVNSRPITAENLYDPTGPDPLTPNHLLTMKSKVWLPTPGCFDKEDMYTRQRWRRVQYLANQFWDRWRKEYLLLLQARQKWQGSNRNVKVGDVVLLKEENLVRCCWKLGKITEVVEGKDKQVRRVRILMSDPNLSKQGKRLATPTILERPVHKLVVLIESETGEE